MAAFPFRAVLLLRTLMAVESSTAGIAKSV